MTMEITKIVFIDDSDCKNYITFEFSNYPSAAEYSPSIHYLQPCPGGLLSAIFFLDNFTRFPSYRNLVIKFLEKTLPLIDCRQNNENSQIFNIQIDLFIKPWNLDTITIVDTKWSHRFQYLARMRLEMEESLSWLSTLGGAYSSLGDYKIEFAKQAERISLSQLRLSLLYSDPNLTARCLIYLCHSWGQQHKRKKAIRLLKNFLYPFLLQIGPVKRDIVVQRMYQALCFRIRYIYK